MPERVKKRRATCTRQTLTIDEVGRLVASIGTDTVIDLRDRALISLIMDTGARGSQALSMRVADHRSPGRVRLPTQKRLMEVSQVEAALGTAADKAISEYVFKSGIAADPEGPQRIRLQVRHCC